MPPSSLSKAPIKFQQRAPPSIYAAPTSRAAGSLFCGAPWTARHRRPPCARCFAQPIRDAVENRANGRRRALPVRRNTEPCGRPCV
nr:unknown [Zea mays]